MSQSAAGQMTPGGAMVEALPPMEIAARLGRLRSRLQAESCEALVVSGLANVRYLTGFSGSAALLLVPAEGRALLVTDGRYRAQASEQLSRSGVEASLEIGNVPEQLQALARAARATGRVGLEAGNVTWARKRALAEVIDAELLATTGLVEGLRLVKDSGEVARIEAAARIADEALAEVGEQIGAGPSEADVARSLDFAMRRLGAVSSSFETIVASGPNAAMPHARPTDRPIGTGELTVVDFGAVVDGYCSDMTRTLCAGAPAADVSARIFEVVKLSQHAGVSAVRAGARAADVDAACRSVIEDAGWGDHFVHGTGHGVGLEIHEAPAVAASSVDKLEARTVVTVEPGVYMPGQGGVRIEDTVVVTATGCRTLTKFPKDLTLP